MEVFASLDRRVLADYKQVIRKVCHLEQATAGVISEHLSIANVATQCINALVTTDIHHFEYRCAARSG